MIDQIYAAVARQVLLDVKQMPPYGLAATELTPAALERYGPTIDRLRDAMRIARQLRAGTRIGVEVNGIEGTIGKDSQRRTWRSEPRRIAVLPTPPEDRLR